MRLLCQIGKQSKYILSASELMSLEISFPGFQRETSDEHIQQIVTHQRHLFHLFGHYLFPGCLEFGRHNNVLHCLDGQHRYYCMKQLLEDTNGLGDFEVVIEIVNCSQLEELHEWFTIINSNRPIPQFLLESPFAVCVTASTASAASASASASAAASAAPAISPLLQLREHLRVKYPVFLSKSDKPLRPNINLDQFLQEIHQRQLDKEENLMEWIEAENEKHGAYLKSQRGVGHEQIERYLTIITEKKVVANAYFYLGVYWLDSVKNKVSARLRKKVWETWWGSLPAEKKHASGEAPCPCCDTSLISGFEFEAGHRTSFRNGGLHELSNLIPLCGACNRSMGVMNYDEYRRILHT